MRGREPGRGCSGLALSSPGDVVLGSSAEDVFASCVVTPDPHHPPSTCLTSVLLSPLSNILIVFLRPAVRRIYPTSPLFSFFPPLQPDHLCCPRHLSRFSFRGCFCRRCSTPSPLRQHGPEGARRGPPSADHTRLTRSRAASHLR